MLILLLLVAAQLSADGGGNVPPPATRTSLHNQGGGVSGTPVGGLPSERTGGDGVEIIPDSETPASIARDLSQSPLFALTSGLASILGLLFTLYATQVRTIPFSLYRSLMWRKALLLSSGTGLLVFGGMKFYMQEEAPYILPLREVHALLLGVLRVSAVDFQPHGSSVWAIIWVIGGLLLIAGLAYDPASRARVILVREQQALQEAQAQQLSHVLRGRKISDLQPPERRVFDDTLEYYRHVQWRFADVVLGAPPPTFPLFHQDRERTSREDDA